MIDLYFWTTPNGIKPLILLEEIDLEHIVHPVYISNGEQIGRAFSAISPNQKTPTIVGRAPALGGLPPTPYKGLCP